MARPNAPTGIVPSEASVAQFQKIVGSAYSELASKLTEADVTNNTRRYQVMQKIDELVARTHGDLKAWATVNVPAFYEKGLFQSAQQLAERGSPVKIRTSYGSFHTQAVEAIANDTLARIGESMTGITRTSSKIISNAAQRAIEERIGKGIVTGANARVIAKEIKQTLAQNGFTALVDKGGRSWDLKTYSEMLARTKLTEAHNSGLVNRMTEAGYDLVIISAHAGSCKLCSPWQGEVLSLSGDNQAYSSLSEAEDQGLFHPNCRHDMAPYHAEYLDGAKIWNPETQQYELYDDSKYTPAEVKMPKNPNIDTALQNAGVSPFADKTVYRAVDSKTGVAALGKGVYFSPDKSIAAVYGDNVKPFTIDPKAKFLDLRKDADFQSYMTQALKGLGDKATAIMAQYPVEVGSGVVLQTFAQQQGYDGIIGQSSIGSVVFDSGLITPGTASALPDYASYIAAYRAGNVEKLEVLRLKHPNDARFALHLQYAPAAEAVAFANVLKDHKAQLKQMGIENVPAFHDALERGDKPEMRRIANGQPAGDLKNSMLRLIDLL